MQLVRDKLIEAAAVYRKDKETLDWHVMQDPKVRCLLPPLKVVLSTVLFAELSSELFKELSTVLPSDMPLSCYHGVYCAVSRAAYYTVRFVFYCSDHCIGDFLYCLRNNTSCASANVSARSRLTMLTPG